MARISFWGGVGVIGSSKILIEQDGWRVLLDCGLDYQPGAGLFRLGVNPRPEVHHRLRDRLRIGGAPHIPHLYRPEAVGDLSLPAGADGKTAVFISHGHLDHVGMVGHIDPAVPIFASAGTIKLLKALDEGGDSLEGGIPAFREMPPGAALEFGPFRITRYDVDHDIVGASGYAVETDNGVVAFTGDIRLHGRRGHESLQFADAVHGARALVIEGTTLTAGFRTPERSEAAVDQSFHDILLRTPGLVLLTAYPRNVERLEAFVAMADDAGRTLCWPDGQARFLEAYWGRPVASWGSERSQVSIGDIQQAPQQFVLQLPKELWPAMLDLPLGPGSVFVHANGEPLGPYDPMWDVLQDWLKHVHTPFWAIGTSGHASPDDLNRLVERVAPEILFPLHSQEPDRLIPPPGTVRWLPQRGRVFDLSGRPPAL